MKQTKAATDDELARMFPITQTAPFAKYHRRICCTAESADSADSAGLGDYVREFDELLSISNVNSDDPAFRPDG
jgi:hypothetical protein